MERFTQEQVDERLTNLPEWTQSGDSLQRTFAFDDFASAFEFVRRVADHAETVQHHPDILVRYNKVTLTLSTHDAGGLTGKDFEFAEEMDAYAAPAR